MLFILKTFITNFTASKAQLQVWTAENCMKISANMLRTHSLSNVRMLQNFLYLQSVVDKAAVHKVALCCKISIYCFSYKFTAKLFFL